MITAVWLTEFGKYQSDLIVTIVNLYFLSFLRICKIVHLMSTLFNDFTDQAIRQRLNSNVSDPVQPQIDDQSAPDQASLCALIQSLREQQAALTRTQENLFSLLCPQIPLNTAMSNIGAAFAQLNPNNLITEGTFEETKEQYEEDQQDEDEHQLTNQKEQLEILHALVQRQKDDEMSLVRKMREMHVELKQLKSDSANAQENLEQPQKKHFSSDAECQTDEIVAVQSSVNDQKFIFVAAAHQDFSLQHESSL